MHEPFSVPDFWEFVENFGVVPRNVDGETVEVDFTEVTGEEVVFYFNPVGRSISFRWVLGKDQRISIFREGANRLRISTEGQEVFLVSDFSTDSLAGRMHLRIFPSVNIEDELLFT